MFVHFLNMQYEFKLGYFTCVVKKKMLIVICNVVFGYLCGTTLGCPIVWRVLDSKRLFEWQFCHEWVTFSYGIPRKDWVIKKEKNSGRGMEETGGERAQTAIYFVFLFEWKRKDPVSRSLLRRHRIHPAVTSQGEAPGSFLLHSILLVLSHSSALSLESFHWAPTACQWRGTPTYSIFLVFCLFFFHYKIPGIILYLWTWRVKVDLYVLGNKLDLNDHLQRLYAENPCIIVCMLTQQHFFFN